MSKRNHRLVLITGGCGFIGRHLSLRLRNQGDRVRILDSLSPQVHGADYDGTWIEEHDIDFLKASVCDPSACIEATRSVDAVIHLAAETGTGQSMYEMARYMDTNVTGTATLLEACAQQRVPKVVLSSSRAVYGEGMWECRRCGLVHPKARSSTEGRATGWSPSCPLCNAPVESLAPTPEDSPMGPTSVYGISKLTQELLVLGMKDMYPVDVSVLRFFNVFGPGQSLSNPYTGVLAVFVNRARENKTIDLYEDGEILRDFVYIDDVVEALVRTLHSRATPVCNIGSGSAVSIRHLAQTIIELVESKSGLQVTGKGRVGDIRGLEANISTAARTLGWAPSVPVDEGLRHFVHWAISQVYKDRYERSLHELERRGLYR